MKQALLVCPACKRALIWGKWERHGFDLNRFTVIPLRCDECYEAGMPGKNLPVKKE